ncbi:MAG: SDR family oxidoreductase [Candidatus Methanofastidiosum sp.]|nr:SDR family oxidoreductase [Methanofastidiosum sp.]
MKILILGSDGMLGHVVKTYFEERGHEIVCTNRNDKESNLYFDITNSVSGIDKIVENVKPEVLINCIGILNKVAEEHKALAILINSYLPHYLDELSAKAGFKLIHVSTDCVFDGKVGGYDEHSIPNETNMYGRSKALGEVINDRSVTLRTSIVGPDINKNGVGLFQWFMTQEGEVGGYDNVIWTGVTTMWFARCMEIAIEKNLTGLHHCVNNETISKYDLITLFKKYFDKDIIINHNPDVVSKKTLVRTDASFDFGIPSYEQMVKEMREWVIEHKEMYPDLIKDMKLN